jgi:four helix bundle protein
MGAVSCFEELKAWQKARALTKRVYDVTRRGEFAKDYGLARQIQRAAVSVMSNIAEGFERGNRREFHQFLFVAKASCAEVRSELYISFDVGYLSQDELRDLLELAEEVSRIIGGLRSSVSKPRPDRA